VHREPAEDHDPTPPAGSARSLSQGSMVCLAPSMDAKLC
jgi:hypothetical protein